MEARIFLAQKVCGAAVLLSVLGAAAAQSEVRPPEKSPSAGHSDDRTAPAVAGEEGLHLTVGRSMVLSSQGRLRRVFVTNPDVITSLTSSPTQIVISARAAGSSSVILWDESGGSQTYFVSADVDVSGLEEALKEALPASSLQVVAHQNRVSLAGKVDSEASSELAAKLAGIYAKNVVNSLQVSKVPIPQVQLKVRMVEVDRSRLSQAGFNFFTAGRNTTTVTTGQFPSIVSGSSGSSSGSGSGSSSLSSLLTLSDPLNLLYYNSSLGIGEAIRALEEKRVLQILAEPTITTLSGEKASFLSGGEFPFPVVQGGTGGFTSVTVQFRPYGVRLDFTPVVTAPGVIQLKVSPEVSALDFSNAVTISGYTIPAIATRRADTQVEVRNGESFAISGLLDHRTTELFQKIPGIGEIPVLGNLFRSKSINRSVVELMVIVTPTVVDPLTENTKPQEPALPAPLLTPESFDRTPPKKIHPAPEGKQP